MSGRTLRWLMSWAPRSRRHAPGRERARLTIVRHHRVYADGERPLYRLGVSESVFRQQLEMLVALGRTPITAAEGWRRVREGRPGDWVALTFDDGYADNVGRALPHLRAVAARATFYLTAGLMDERRAPWWDRVTYALERARRPRLAGPLAGRHVDVALESRSDREQALRLLMPALACEPGERDRRIAALREALGVTDEPECELMDWDGAAELARAGMELGAHTLTHPLLGTLPAEDQRSEIAGSVDLIERRTGIRPVGLAYPGGDHDQATLAVVAGMGLAYAVTTRAGTVGPESPSFELPRRGLSEGACLGPAGRFSRRLARAELEGAFDRLRGVEVAT